MRTARGRLEHLRISDLNDRFLPCPPATILDIGGGTGPYAHPLAAAGYSVHLLDATPLHVVEAIKAASPEHPLTSATVGDARALPFEDALADAALLFGPLYHLHDRSDRLLALREAHRVLRPGGRLFATAISRYASFMRVCSTGCLPTLPSRKSLRRICRLANIAIPGVDRTGSPTRTSTCPTSSVQSWLKRASS